MPVVMTNKETLKLAMQSIGSNKLRTFLTALIIAIGLTALVGILTSIDAIKSSLNNTFSSLGANSFTIRNRGIGIRFGGGGQAPKRFPSITFAEATDFKERFNFPAMVSVSTYASQGSTVKFGSNKTNPNIAIVGGDENYVTTANYKIAAGRNFSSSELAMAANVVLIGDEIKVKLFPNADPINRTILIGNIPFKIIGLFEKKGSSVGLGGDKLCAIPLIKTKQISSMLTPTYTITVMTASSAQSESAIGEATAIFRNVRSLKAGIENNFEITKSDAIVQTLLDNIKYITLAAIVIAFVTLAGASIGLMNIMLVSVTERTREIGIRKAIGATPSVIRKQFLMEAIVICMIGGVVGILLGIIIGNLIATVLGASFIVPWKWMLVGSIICILVGMVAGFYPASKASQLDPIESLRYE